MNCILTRLTADYQGFLLDQILLQGFRSKNVAVLKGDNRQCHYDEYNTVLYRVYINKGNHEVSSSFWD